MPKLNQIVAILQGRRTQAQKDVAAVYKRLQKSALFDGISRVYQPLDEDGETLPAETKNVQYTARRAVQEVRQALGSLFDVAATQDYANCAARADIVVDGTVILAEVPVTHLLFVEKQLTDLHTFVGQVPVLDPADRWEWDQAADCFATESFITNRTKKIPRSHILYDATKEHPAQVEMYMEDVKVGEWRTVKFSGALPAQEQHRMLERIRRLQQAVKFAREEANSMSVDEKTTADGIFEYLFGVQS